MTESPRYVLALCEGDRRVLVLAFTDSGHNAAPGSSPARLLATLGVLAARLRDLGAVGRLLLLDQDRGEVVAARRVWP